MTDRFDGLTVTFFQRFDGAEFGLQTVLKTTQIASRVAHADATAMSAK